LYLWLEYIQGTGVKEMFRWAGLNLRDSFLITF
jgi:hypothetical protein